MKIDEVILFKIFVFGSNHSKRIKVILTGRTNLRCGSYGYIAMAFLNKHKNTELSYLLKQYIPRYLLKRTLSKVLPASTECAKPSQRFLKAEKKCILYVGDSHAEFWSRILAKKRNEAVHALHLGPILANTFANDDTKSRDIVSFLTAAKEKFVFDEIYLVLIFGEIDVRAHSWAQVHLFDHYANVQEYASCLADKFAITANRLKNRLTREIDWLKTDVVIRRQVPPSDCKYLTPRDKKMLGNIFQKNKAPVLGTNVDRVTADKLLWGEIKRACFANNLICQDLPSFLYTSHGNLDPNFSEDSCHVTDMNGIRHTHNALLKLLNRFT